MDRDELLQEQPWTEAQDAQELTESPSNLVFIAVVNIYRLMEAGSSGLPVQNPRVLEWDMELGELLELQTQ